MADGLEKISNSELVKEIIWVENRIKEWYNNLKEKDLSETVEAFEHTKPQDLKKLEMRKDEILVELKKRQISWEKIEELKKKFPS